MLNRLPGVSRCNSGAMPTTPIFLDSTIVDGIWVSDTRLFACPLVRNKERGRRTFGGLQTAQQHLVNSPRTSYVFGACRCIS